MYNNDPAEILKAIKYIFSTNTKKDMTPENIQKYKDWTQTLTKSQKQIFFNAIITYKHLLIQKHSLIANLLIETLINFPKLKKIEYFHPLFYLFELKTHQKTISKEILIQLIKFIEKQDYSFFYTKNANTIIPISERYKEHCQLNYFPIYPEITNLLKEIELKQKLKNNK